MVYNTTPIQHKQKKGDYSSFFYPQSKQILISPRGYIKFYQGIFMIFEFEAYLGVRVFIEIYQNNYLKMVMIIYYFLIFD